LVAGVGAFDGFADVGVGCDVEVAAVGGFEGDDEGVGVLSGDEVDGASAEAAAGEAGAEAAREVDGRGDEEVDLCATALEVVALAGVGFGHQLAELNGVAGEHGLFGCADAGVFGDDVAAAAERLGGHERLTLLKFEEGGVAEVAEVGEALDEDGLTGFELAAAKAVVATGDGVFDHGVADYDTGFGERAVVHGQMLVGEGAGIEQERMTGLGGGDDELVHDAAGGVDILIFGALAETGDLFNRERGVGVCEEGHCGGDFNRGGGAKAGAEGNIAAKIEGEGRWFDAEQLELAEDADGVVGPVACGFGAVVEGGVADLGEEIAVEAVTGTGVGGDRCNGEEGDRHGEDETAGVVGVLADEVDAGGRGEL